MGTPKNLRGRIGNAQGSIWTTHEQTFGKHTHTGRRLKQSSGQTIGKRHGSISGTDIESFAIIQINYNTTLKNHKQTLKKNRERNKNDSETNREHIQTFGQHKQNVGKAI
jgi:hypothetical protein